MRKGKNFNTPSTPPSAPLAPGEWNIPSAPIAPQTHFSNSNLSRSAKAFASTTLNRHPAHQNIVSGKLLEIA